MPKQRYAPRPRGRLSGTVQTATDNPKDPANPFTTESYTAPFNSRLFRHKSLGLITGALRPSYPKMFRPYGTNTRETVAKLKNTGILDNKYDKDIVSKGACASGFLGPHATLAQSGSPAVLAGIPSLKPGPHHWLFDG
jgi:hypothetical protein